MAIENIYYLDQFTGFIVRTNSDRSLSTNIDTNFVGLKTAIDAGSPFQLLRPKVRTARGER
jgi:hypothetical protein